MQVGTVDGADAWDRVVRGVSELAEYDIDDPVAEPAIRVVRSSDGLVVASNDAALIVELPVGAYTVGLSSADGAPGISLLGAHEVPGH